MSWTLSRARAFFAFGIWHRPAQASLHRLLCQSRGQFGNSLPDDMLAEDRHFGENGAYVSFVPIITTCEER